jgi:dTDP-4-amino-4,6-dideoxygalactose transaminase
MIKMLFKIIPRMNLTPAPDLLKDFFKLTLTEKILKGNCIEKFEEEFANYIGTKHAIAVSSGRYGMKLILESLKLKKGDEIIVPTYTLDALPVLIKNMSLKPVFVDITQKKFNIDSKLIERRISKKTKAILATHLFGTACDLDKILKIAKKYSLYVIEDCAHSLGTEFKGKKVGYYGKASFFSLELRKPINTLGGGIITTNDDKLAKKIRMKIGKLDYSYKEILMKILMYYSEFILLNSFLYYFVAKILHSKFRKKIRYVYQKYHRSSSNVTKFTNFQAILGLKQLKILDTSNKNRVEKAKLMTKLLSRKKSIILPKSIKNSNHIYYSYVILTNQNAQQLSDRLLKMGIDTSFGDSIMQNCPANLGDKTKYPQIEKIMKFGLELPMYNRISQKNILYIAKSIQKVI